MNTAKRVANLILGFFPHKLPIGMDDFQKFVAAVFWTYGIPNTSSYQDLVANVILHSKETDCFIRPFHLYRIIRKAQANEIAWHTKENIKAKAKLALDAEKSEQTKNIVDPTIQVGSVDVATTH